MVARSTVCPETGNVTGSRISSCGADLVKIGEIGGAVKPGERSKRRGGGGGRRLRLRERVQELLWDLRRAVAWAAASAACRDTPALAGSPSGRIPGPPRNETRPRRRARRGAGGKGRSRHRARAPRALRQPPPRRPARPTPRGAPRAEKGFTAQSGGERALVSFHGTTRGLVARARARAGAGPRATCGASRAPGGRKANDAAYASGPGASERQSLRRGGEGVTPRGEVFVTPLHAPGPVAERGEPASGRSAGGQGAAGRGGGRTRRDEGRRGGRGARGARQQPGVAARRAAPGGSQGRAAARLRRRGGAARARRAGRRRRRQARGCA
jgi:hypothetical protein